MYTYTYNDTFGEYIINDFLIPTKEKKVSNERPVDKYYYIRLYSFGPRPDECHAKM